MNGALRASVIVLALLLPRAFGAAAPEPEPGALPLLTNAQQVLALGPEGSARSPHPVRVRGVVTLPVLSRQWCYMQDATAGLLIIYTNAGYTPRAGQLVEVEGRAGPGEFAAHVFDAQVRVIGTAPLPEPRRTEAARLAAGEDFGGWEQLEGRVHDVALSSSEVLFFVGGSEAGFWARAQLQEPMRLPVEWLDAKVQVRGVCWTSTDRELHPNGFSLHLPSTNCMTLLEAGSSNVFDRPLVSARSLQASPPRSDARVKVIGVVTLCVPGRWLFLQDDTGPIKARLLVPLLQAGPASNYLSRPYLVPVEPGDRLEVVGTPLAWGFGPLIGDAEYRRIGSGVAPTPVPTAVSELLSGSQDGRLVEVRAHLLDRETHQVGSTKNDLLILQEGEHIFQAWLQSDKTNGLTELPRNAFLQVTGVCHIEADQWRALHTMRLLLRGPGDVRVIERPPLWASWHAGRILAIAGVAGAVGLTWIWLLRRRVRQRTAQLLRANEALRTSEARYRTLVENAPEAIVVLDTQTGRFIEANENALRLFGHTRAGLLRAGPAELSPLRQPDGRSSAEAATEKIEAALSGNGAAFEWLHRRADGTDFPCEVRVARLPVPGRQLVIGAVTDITERKRAETEMQNALAAERELGELKSRFVSMVSHEFRTPLGIIMSSAEILQTYLERLSPEKRREHLTDIFQSTRRMADLMEEVLFLSRMEAGRLEFKPAPMELSGFCRRLTDEVLSATQERCPICFQEGGAVGAACGDEALLRHILTNLLSNALKYSPPGRRVEFMVERRGVEAVFTVRDQGIGIPDGDRKQLFQAFHRARNVGEIPGSGLGLVIVKRCVELHGGSLSFETQEGAGTVFSVRLPLFEAVAPAPARPVQ